IRPSPTGGLLGGLAGNTREAILLCEAAGYDVIIVETVGAGQNEVALRSLVDVLLLLLITGAGDELQGLKKGVIEIADALIINKADGDNLKAAQTARAQFQRALQYVAPATAGWDTRALTASGLTGAGIPDIWVMIKEFGALTKASGVFQRRRSDQRRDWLHSALEAQLRSYLFEHEAIQTALPAIEAAVMSGEMSAADAADKLLRMILPR
ncbi:MAG: methylmalonyl Co-A mutase-associated GTPase MeaB, partial [Chloroflexi bacterium]|nr:methylmalonyl Co-A mutase-associated GTPase MeaB [Chloroflexota bacterium]